MADKEVAAPAVQGTRESSSPVVSVACKMGIAWLDLQLCEPRVVQENTQTGARDVTVFQRTGPVVRIRGTAYPRGPIPDGFPERPEMVAGHAVTRNVDRKFWEKWVDQHKHADYVKNGMVFAFSGLDDIKARGRELEKIPSGLEPIERGRDADGEEAIVDPRMPRPMIAGLSTAGMRKAG